MNPFYIMSPSAQKDQLLYLIFEHVDVTKDFNIKHAESPVSLFQQNTLICSDPFVAYQLRIGDMLCVGEMEYFQVIGKSLMHQSVLPVFNLRCVYDYTGDIPSELFDGVTGEVLDHEVADIQGVQVIPVRNGNRAGVAKSNRGRLFTQRKIGFTLAVITLSDKGFAGKRVDESGPSVQNLVGESIHLVENRRFLLPDNKAMLRELVTTLARNQGYDLIITTGGTGLSETDITAEALLPLLDSRLSGFEIAMMQKSIEKTPMAMISRAFCGIMAKSIILAVPGSVKGAVENVEVVLPALSHALAKLGGDTSDCADFLNK